MFRGSSAVILLSELQITLGSLLFLVWLVKLT